MRKLVAIAVSNVMYLRGIFPERVFADREFAGLPLKIIRGNESCPGSLKLVRWLGGVFHALERSYLRKMTLAVHSQHAGQDDVLEAYTFKFGYIDNSVNTGQVLQGNRQTESAIEVTTDPKAVLRCAVQMMRSTLFFVQTLEPLPAKIQLSMKLMYFDDVTPAEYQPPGFRALGSSEYKFDSDPLSMNVGKVSTPYHTVLLNCKTDTAKFDKINKLSSEAIENMTVDDDIWSQNTAKKPSLEVPWEDITSMPMQPPEVSQEPSSDECIPPTPRATSPDVLHSSLRCTERIMYIPTPMANTQSSDMRRTGSTDDSRLCNCICGCDLKMGVMMLCSVCYSWSHAPCYGFVEDIELPKCFVCVGCHQLKGQVCSDTKLLTVQPSQRQEVCLYRRTLALCLDAEFINAATLCCVMGIEQITADKIMSRLVSDKIIKKIETNKTGSIVNQEVLRNYVLGQYFGQIATLGLNRKNGVKKSKKNNEDADMPPKKKRRVSQTTMCQANRVC